MSQNIQSCYNYYRCHSRRPIITSSGLRSVIKRGLTSLTSYVQNLTLLKKWEKTFLQQPRFFFIEGEIVRILILIKQVLLIHSFISSFILNTYIARDYSEALPAQSRSKREGKNWTGREGTNTET